MQIYWSFKSIPELAELPPAVRGRVWREVFWKTYRHWQTWAAAVGAGLCSAAGGYLGLLLDPSTTSQIIGIAVGAGLGGFAYGQVLTEFARPYLRAFLAVQQFGGESRP